MPRIPAQPSLLHRLTRRLLPALELTRLSMVFTAMADGLCTLILLAKHRQEITASHEPVLLLIDPRLAGAMVIISIALYGYGMVLNDIIDHRRDRQIASHRPLPSGRIGIRSAHLLCFILAVVALAAGSYFSLHSADGWRTLILVACVGTFISFYDFAAKYLVGPGFFLLGLIRFFHALIPAPSIPLLWHPLWLMNHMVLLCLIVYRWHDKRPALTPSHVWGALGGLLLFDAGCLLMFGMPPVMNPAAGQWGLIPPLIVTLIFVILAWWVRRASASPRRAAERLMRLGLGWLILYDAAFVAGYVNWRLAGFIAALLPLAWLAGRMMRGGLHLWSLRRPPAFKRPSERQPM